jgi:hypothetical protein
MDFKKKVCKNENHFFFDFFLRFFFAIFYDKWSDDFLRNCNREHKKKSEKIWIFRDFSGFFGIFLIFLGPVGQLLDKFKDFLDNGG